MAHLQDFAVRRLQYQPSSERRSGIRSHLVSLTVAARLQQQIADFHVWL